MSRRFELRALGFAAACAITFGACQDDRAEITDPVGRVYNARFAVAGTNLPRGGSPASQVRAGLAAAHSIFVDLRGLEGLQSGTYSVWLASQTANDAELTNVVPATGELTRFQVDTTIDAAGDPVATITETDLGTASSFADAAAHNVYHQLRVTQATLAAAGAANTDPNAYNVLFVTIEPGAPGATPTAGAPAPLWARFGDLAGATNRTAPVRFGNFAPNPDDEYIFTPAGRGLVGVWDNLLVVDDSALSLPPEGYYYATVLTRGIDTGTEIETEEIFLGPQRAPYPDRGVSLFDADIDPDLHRVVLESPPSIEAASERVAIDTIATGVPAEQPFRLFQNVIVSLEPKQGVPTFSKSIILTATFPDIVAEPPQD
jgi:hypothetical protein